MTTDSVISQPRRTTEAHFVSFCVQTLDGKPLPRPPEHPCSLDGPASMKVATVDTVCDIINRAVLGSLCRDSGWCRTLAVDHGTDRPRTAALWDEPGLSDVQLAFSSDAVDTLRCTFNLLYGPPHAANTDAVGRILRGLPLPQNGDLLLHALVFQRLSNDPGLRERRDLFAHNPLVVLTRGHILDRGEAIEAGLSRLDRLLEPDFEPLLPWLGLDWSAQWCRLESRRWTRSSARFDRINVAQARILGAWIDLVARRRRWDLMAPVARYFAALATDYSGSGPWRHRLDDLTRGRPLVERRELGLRWASVLEHSDAIMDAYRLCRQVHPADRTASHLVFMQICEDLNYERVHETLDQIRTIIRPSVG